jgi:hypothetical protein
MGDLAAAVVLLVTLAAIAASCAGGDGDTPPPASRPVPAPTDWGEPVAGLSCAITLAATTFGPGEPVVLTVALRNTSDTEQTVWNRGFWPNHGVIVTDQTGAEAALTDQGRLARQAFRRGEARKSIPIHLKPGEVKLPSATVDLATHYQLPAGRYSVVAEYAEGNTVLRSNALTFDVRR